SVDRDRVQVEGLALQAARLEEHARAVRCDHGSAEIQSGQVAREELDRPAAAIDRDAVELGRVAVAATVPLDVDLEDAPASIRTERGFVHVPGDRPEDERAVQLDARTLSIDPRSIEVGAGPVDDMVPLRIDR